jgi:hypothetical protein
MVDARIKKYLPVLTSRRIRQILRERPKGGQAG